MEVTTTVKTIITRTGGKECPVTITRHKGLKTYTDARGREILCDEAVYFDYGPKMGGGWTYIEHKEYTPEERAEGRRRIQQAVTKAMVDQGFW